jgi:peroxiredoxin
MFGRRKKVLVAVGAQAPPFRLIDLDGSTQTLQEIITGGPALLAFYKISCPVCQLTAPYLERLAANTGGLQVIGISQDEASATRGFMQRFGLTFPTLLDLGSEDYPASNAYGITSVPSLFLVERDGTLARSLSGFSKRDFEEIGARAGASPFGPEDYVPEWKAG